MATVLITSVGSLVGQNVLDASAPYRNQLRLLGTNSFADTVSNFRCDACFLAPPAARANAWRAHLRALMQAEAIDLVIPGRDADVFALASWLAEEPQYLGRFLVGSLHAARAFQDKVDCAGFAAQSGLPFAPTVASGSPQAVSEALALYDRFADLSAAPLIAKPRAGNGSRGVRLLLQRSDVSTLALRPGYAIQPYLDPHPKLRQFVQEARDIGVPLWFEIPERALYAAQVLIDPRGQLAGTFCFRAEMSGGRPSLVERDDSPDLAALARAYGQVFAAAGWRGACNVQAKRDPALGLLAIETNGRFSGGTSARSALGFDEVGMVLQQWLGIALAPCAGSESRRVIKQLNDRVLDEAAAQQLARLGHWRK